MKKLKNVFLSFFWKHLCTTKKSLLIDAALIFTSHNRASASLTNEPWETHESHDSTVVYVIA